MPQYIAFSSCGNDSIALIQFLHECGIKAVTVAYNNTGWAIEWWHTRVEKTRALCESYGYKFEEIESIGMEQLVRDKKGWPMAASKMQFCTDFLKTGPSRLWLREYDPFGDAICVTGVRREESQNRKDHPEHIRDSKYEGRMRWFPLVEMKEPERDALIRRAGFDILPHGSMECFPCVCSNRSDFRMLSKYPSLIDKIEKIETEMGFTRNGKPRTMFRPYRHMGATGIREVVKWGIADRGKYKKESTK